MSNWGKYVLAALGIAVAGRIVAVDATPRLLMSFAIGRLGGGGFNQWRLAPRVTEHSRAIVRPAPDFAYSACAYDLGRGPVRIRVAPSADYWSLSLYAANSDNFFVTDDRESRAGAEIVLVRRGRRAPEGARVVESPSRRGVALIRRLAPTVQSYNAAAEAAREDECAPLRAG